MRFSVNKEDAGYQNYQALRSAKVVIDVLVDGEEVKDVRTADDLVGIVVRGVRDDKGNFKTIAGNFVEETIRGKVEIRISQPKPVEADVDGE